MEILILLTSNGAYDVSLANVLLEEVFLGGFWESFHILKKRHKEEIFSLLTFNIVELGCNGHSLSVSIIRRNV